MKLFRSFRIVFAAVAQGIALPLALAGLAAVPTQAQNAEGDDDGPRPAIAEYNLEKGLAISGYDPVAYFPEGGGKPLEGKQKITAKHRGVTYRFAKTANRDRFLAEPAKYEASFGGWCSYAMANGKQVEVDPKSFLIEDGQLLLFYKGFLNNTRSKWKKEGSAKLRPQANRVWEKISGEKGGRA